MKYSRSGYPLETKYSPDQERDDAGRFGGGAAGASRASENTRAAGAHGRESRNARAATDKAKLIQKTGTPKQKIAAHERASDMHLTAAASALSNTAIDFHEAAAQRHAAAAEHERNKITGGAHLDRNAPVPGYRGRY